MEIAMIVLSGTGQQILGYVEIIDTQKVSGIITCHDPLQIGWVQPDKKLTRVLMTLSVFPPMINAIAADLSGHSIVLRATDVVCVTYAPQLKPEAIVDYMRRRQEVYGKIAVVSDLPQGLKGEA